MILPRRSFLKATGLAASSVAFPFIGLSGTLGPETAIPKAASTNAVFPKISPEQSSDAALRYWPQWRGPLANGVAPYANPPVDWSEKKNIRWKIPLPGKAHSSPIVFGERV